MEQKQKDDLRYISDPMLWNLLLCPVIREVNGNRECAYLIGDGPNLYHGNIYDAKKEDRKEEFDSYRKILEAGWGVD